ncbi:MAG: tryptophan-rich sensory protein [Alphaproteobacteria bacterium]|nr:tryptophan-rich sensory protein [Alphaproteobacteria bacterium]
MKKFFQFIIAMLISFIPGIFGVMFTPNHGSDAWFNALNKSVLTPDGWVFSVAWTILYALLGWALYLIISNEKTRLSKARAYWLFFAQMVLNFAWTYLYFGLHLVGVALFVLIALIVIAIWMAGVFKPISKLASYLVWPYIIWMLFATYLNASILFLN